MLTLNLFDNNFPNQVCSVANQTPKTCRYVRNQMEWDGITLFTDKYIYDGTAAKVQSRYKVGWLHEGIELRPENYYHALGKWPAFDGILTTERSLWQHSDKFWPTIRGGCWLPEATWGLYAKQESVSMILSDKTELSGHQLRHAIAHSHLPIDTFGPSYSDPGFRKYNAYSGYRFAVIIEASRRKDWFSEHLLDCIAYGTIPIYWGCPNIGQYLDIEGILPIANQAALEDLLPYLTPSLYEYMLPYARHNIDLMKQYAITEDWFVPNILEPFLDYENHRLRS